MGHDDWKRHVIINAQPGDKIVDKAVTRLQQKPIREQGQERLAIELKRLAELDLDASAKVYIVGHGGDNKLGKMHPEGLAAQVFEKLKNVEQISLIMCGTGDVTLANRFARQLVNEYNYQGAVYAYGRPLMIDEHGKKLGAVNLNALGIEDFTSQKAALIEGIKGEMPVPARRLEVPLSEAGTPKPAVEPPQAVAESDDESLLALRANFFAEGKA
jgi:hypothetical protein